MIRSSFLMSAGKRLALAAGLALLVVVAAPRVASAQEQDALKFSASGPVTLIFQVKADQTAAWEEGWAYIFGLMSKSADPDLKAMGESMAGKMFKVDQAPFKVGAFDATIYVFQLDAVSTKFSYSPREIVYTYLKAGQDGGPSRAEVDPQYAKVAGAYLGVSTWKLVKK